MRPVVEMIGSVFWGVLRGIPLHSDILTLFVLSLSTLFHEFLPYPFAAPLLVLFFSPGFQQGRGDKSRTPLICLNMDTILL